LPILYFVREYISAQKAKEHESNQKIMEIEEQIRDLRKKTESERNNLRSEQQDLLLLFVQKLNDSHF
jgi:hypothetical protein